MNFTTRMIIPAAAFALALGASPVMAQEAPAPAAPAQQEEPQMASLQGDLIRVDADAKTLWVKSADADAEQAFSFTDETEIVGEGRSVEGLATMTGTRVKVDYKTEGDARVATRIEIQAPEAAAPAQPAPQQ